MEADTKHDQIFEQFVQKYLQDVKNRAKADSRVATSAELESERANLEEWYGSGKKVLATVEPGLKEACCKVYEDVMRKANNHYSVDLAVFAFRHKVVVAPYWLTVYSDTKAVIEKYRAATGLSPL
jgi:hypothetical protein